jgi:hypothetical protein
VRRQAAFHSTLVICVSRSQKPMQSASVLPPPPGALGADSLGLPDAVLGDSARLGWVTPPVANCVGSCGESGGIGASSGMGAAIADGGVVASGGGGDGEVLVPGISRGDGMVPQKGCHLWQLCRRGHAWAGACRRSVRRDVGDRGGRAARDCIGHLEPRADLGWSGGGMGARQTSPWRVRRCHVRRRRGWAGSVATCPPERGLHRTTAHGKAAAINGRSCRKHAHTVRFRQHPTISAG